MSRWQITVPVCKRVVLRLCPMGDAHGGPQRPKSGGALSLWQAFRPSYGITPPGGGFGANNPVAGAKPPLVSN
jgi:hypothetical protein